MASGRREEHDAIDSSGPRAREPRPRARLGRTLVVYLALAGIAFAVGTSGLPGRAVAAVAEWLSATGRVELSAPAQEALRGTS